MAESYWNADGRLNNSVFFHLEFPFDSAFQRPGWTLAVDQLDPNCNVSCFAKIDRSIWNRRRDCPIDSTHVSGVTLSSGAVDLFASKSLTSFIPSSFDEPPIISEQFANRLAKSTFSGFSIQEAVIASNQTRIIKPKLRILQFCGRIWRRYRILGIPNSCEWCGRTPLICETCGNISSPCLDCGKGSKLAVNAYAAPMEGIILSGSSWDGSDFLNANCAIVSRRVLDWLLEEQIGPFQYRACRVSIDDMSTTQKNALSELGGANQQC